jgi:aryl-alcohol dehydrogenase-like predicted oxidoreductase
MIAQRPFGRTGHISGRALLGAAAFGQVTQAEADAAIEFGLERGVNHIDTAASYGESELRIGSWIQRHGKPFFLATKTGERAAGPARDQIRRSLERLQLEAAIAAREEGLVRFIGVTGHGLLAPAQHRRALERFDFDSVLCPFSYILSQNREYWADVTALLEVCSARNVAVQTIKAIVRAPWGERPQVGPTWYEPLRDQAEIDLAVAWVLAHPAQVFLNTAGDVSLLEKVLSAVERAGAAPADAAPSDTLLAAQLERMNMSHLFTQPWV